MNLECTTHPFGLLIAVGESRIDAAVAIQFKDRMRDLTGGTAGRILLDLSRVDFVDSSGLGAIVAALKQLDADQKLELAGLTPNVAKVFRLTRMDKVFPIHASVAEAAGPHANAS
ncbi:STAS domain-containing protein [Mangrovicoccus algicola]|uniref:Anti-sigma factor antagonist n=1 Tax=Mangrovicoccus algicola TaxID=2771008 RepID=A0A8J7CJ38_9RHOB|nr:STAS domain-containing protein [Mangrovicoccus algicola]MBE3640350.1 STAS domain-containing protein [Mangrovicoccus algicola]